MGYEYIYRGFRHVWNVFGKYLKNLCAASGVLRELGSYWDALMRTTYRGPNYYTVPVVLLNSDAVVYCISMLPWAVSI